MLTTRENQPTMTGPQIARAIELLEVSKSEFATLCGRSSLTKGNLRSLVIDWEVEFRQPSPATTRTILHMLLLAEVLEPGDADVIAENLLDPKWDGTLPVNFL